jgi:hypothetical protein
MAGDDAADFEFERLGLVGEDTSGGREAVFVGAVTDDAKLVVFHCFDQ